MKIKTKEQYDTRFARRGAAKAPSELERAHDYMRTVIARSPAPSYRNTDVTWRSKPNHKARAQKLEDVFAGMYKPKASKDKISGLPLMGDWQGCAHSLSYWQEDADEKGRPIYFARAMPCTVNHGWKDGKQGIVPDMGKKGDHIDKIGRRW